MGQACLNVLSPFASKFYGLGHDFANGFANGIADGKFIAGVAAAMIGRNAVNKLAEAIDAHSDAVETIKQANNFVNGWVNTLTGRDDDGTKAVESLAKNSLQPLIDVANNAYKTFTELDIKTLLGGGTALYSNGRYGMGTPSAIRAVAEARSKNATTGTGGGIKGGGGAGGAGGITSNAAVARLNYMGTVGTGLTQASELANLGDKLDALGKAVTNMKIVMDSGVVVGQIGSKMDKHLGTAALYAGRG